MTPAQSSGPASTAESFSGNARHRLVRHDDVLGVAAVVADAGDLRLLAVEEEALAARVAHEAVAAVPADADAVARLPLRHLGAHRVDAPGDFVAGDARQREPGKRPPLHERVAVADAARLDLDADLRGTRFRDLALDHLERASAFVT